MSNDDQPKLPISNPGAMLEASVENLAQTRLKIQNAADLAGRNPSDIELVAVSKTFPIEAITPVLDAGQRVFGENRVQEAQSKWPVLKSTYKDVSLHLIGPLQSNKVGLAVQLFDVIETVDRPKLARALRNEMNETGRDPTLFIQVNTGNEPQKAGVPLADLSALIDLCRSIELPIDGLMCIPPVEDEPALHFALLAKLAARHGLEKLSMGMSADFETAVRLGATHVRVGSAIFGARDKAT